MKQTDIETLAIKLSAFAQQLEQRSEQAVRRIETSTAALDRHAQQLSTGSERFAQNALRAISSQAQQVITDNVGEASAALSVHLNDGARSARQAAQSLQAQHAQLSRAQTTLIWKGLGALIIGSVLAVAGSGYFALKNMREIEHAQFGQDILHATQNGVLTRCGQALCAKVGKHPRRYGDSNDYVLLEP